MSSRFSTKAGTLAQLKEESLSADIAPMAVFTVADWLADRNACLVKARSISAGGPWIVRSSCSREDNSYTTNAGAFLTLKDVTEKKLETSIEQVFASYGDARPTEQILIQPMLKDVLSSGVVFSHDPNTCSPYRVVNWSEGNDTSIVTSGRGGRTWIQAANCRVSAPDNLSEVINLLNELLALFSDEPLEFEFACTASTYSARPVLWLLQVRRLILHSQPELEETQFSRLQRIKDKVERGMQPHPFLIGRSTIYGVMPDWNPAEIIGLRPKPLALSLYRELVTDTIWAYQRNNYGYRNLRSFPLMPHFFGLPYIDVRLSLNSFIPADLENSLAEKLVNHYLDSLLSQQSLHDKIEFDVVFSCYTFDLAQRLNRLKREGFSEHERKAISESLRHLTNRIIHPEDGLWRQDAAKIEILQARYSEVLASSTDPLDKIYWLMEDAKRYGTLPFAGLARAGFVAIQILKSLVSVGIFSDADYQAFIAGVSTVSGQFRKDLDSMTKSDFLARYGHLRPGTYDILSPRYDEAPDLYFNWDKDWKASSPAKSFSATLQQTREIEQLIKTSGLHIDLQGLFDFIRTAIELREFAKFQLTRNLSDILRLIVDYGGTMSIPAADLAYCEVACIKELHIAAMNLKEFLVRSIDQGKSRYADTLKVSLPPLITKPEDVWAFELPVTVPNFITSKQVTAPVVSYDDREKLDGALVCIPNADPGFDWLFAWPIAGLITAWGGANSHMAIRAGELGLPAVLGAGEALYERWSNARRLHIDCASRRVEVLL